MSRFRFGAAISAVAMAVAIGLGPAAGTALANGIGDLYVAASAGVDEVHVETESVVNTVELTPAPTALAFNNDGTKLYSGDGGRFVTRIDIETISVEKRIAVPSGVGALAHGRGDLLTIAYPEKKTLGILDPASDTLSETAALPGAVDLVAFDRHETRIVAAEHGETWLAIVDPATKVITKTTLDAAIVALAVDPAGGFAYVATMGADQVVKISLADGKVAWKAALGGAPVALTAQKDAALVSVGPRLYSATDGKATFWATATGEVGALAVSDDLGVVYATIGDTIEAFKGQGKLERTIKLKKDAAPTVLSPVPRASSIAGNGSNSAGHGGGGSEVASGGETGPTASKKPKAPSTDTVSEVLAQVGGPWLPGAIAVAAVLLVLGVGFGRWYARRSAE